MSGTRHNASALGLEGRVERLEEDLTALARSVTEGLTALTETLHPQRETMTCRTLAILDDTGRPAATITAGPAGGGAIAVRNAAGAVVVQLVGGEHGGMLLVAAPDGCPGVVLSACDGVGRLDVATQDGREVSISPEPPAAVGGSSTERA